MATAVPATGRSPRARPGYPPPRLAAALRAAQRGWPVFPLHPYSKYPAVRDWAHRATCDPEQLTQWWARAAYNIAIACQPAGLVVLDLDTGDEPPPPPWDQLGVTHGRDELRVLAQRAGAPDPIDTYTVATPSGGQHRYFLAPTDRQLRNTTGQARGPGMVHRHPRRRRGNHRRRLAAAYQRPATAVPGRARVDPIALPSWLLTALTPPPRPPRAPIPLPSAGPARRLRGRRARGRDHRGSPGRTRRPCSHPVPRRRPPRRTRRRRLLDEALATAALLAAAPISERGPDRFSHREALGHITNGIARGRRHPRSFTGLTG